MSLYNNFIGIDIGKFNFVASVYAYTERCYKNLNLILFKFL